MAVLTFVWETFLQGREKNDATRNIGIMSEVSVKFESYVTPERKHFHIFLWKFVSVLTEKL